MIKTVILIMVGYSKESEILQLSIVSWLLIVIHKSIAWFYNNRLVLSGEVKQGYISICALVGRFGFEI